MQKEGREKINDTLNRIYLWLYGIGHMGKDHSNNERKPTATTSWSILSDMYYMIVYTTSFATPVWCTGWNGK